MLLLSFKTDLSSLETLNSSCSVSTCGRSYWLFLQPLSWASRWNPMRSLRQQYTSTWSGGLSQASPIRIKCVITLWDLIFCISNSPAFKVAAMKAVWPDAQLGSAASGTIQVLLQQRTAFPTLPLMEGARKSSLVEKLRDHTLSFPYLSFSFWVLVSFSLV